MKFDAVKEAGKNCRKTLMCHNEDRKMNETTALLRETQQETGHESRIGTNGMRKPDKKRQAMKR
jgi:hypothetical protein